MHATKSADSAEHHRPEVPDITDTFNLFKTYLDSKLGNLKDQLSTGNDFDSLAKQLKKEVSVNFKHEGHKNSLISIQKFLTTCQSFKNAYQFKIHLLPVLFLPSLQSSQEEIN